MTAIKLPAPPLPRLFLKPPPDTCDQRFLKGIPLSGKEPGIQFRSLDLSTDLEQIHTWVNQPYARRFWQLEGSLDMLRALYDSILQNDRAHAFIGQWNERLICQIDVYGVIGHEVGQHVKADLQDAGLHLLMAPPRERSPFNGEQVLNAFQAYYFSFPEPGQLFAEPDCSNGPANHLARTAGFEWLNTIELSDKTAHLYVLRRSAFEARQTG